MTLPVPPKVRSRSPGAAVEVLLKVASAATASVERMRVSFMVGSPVGLCVASDDVEGIATAGSFRKLRFGQRGTTAND